MMRGKKACSGKYLEFIYDAGQSSTTLFLACTTTDARRGHVGTKAVVAMRICTNRTMANLKFAQSKQAHYIISSFRISLCSRVYLIGP
jgi:hypothetical protein